ncbi:MAG: amidase family protein [Aerococcus sp.]|nr:amidase family protein [Aerococcus sp.]
MRSFNDFKDASAVSEAIKNGELTPVDAVQLALDAIDRENQRSNAVVYVRREEALREAATLTDLSAPFAGVPILIKDLNQHLEGTPLTSGARLDKYYVSPSTDFFVQSLIDAGFIIVGVTNVPEYGFKTQTDSVLHGDAKLPIAPERTPGGSSGGASAAVMSGMVPIASGSDAGGSIRVPASYTGLIGLKPTRGRTAMGPGSWRGWGGASIHFALTRSVRDTERLLLALQTEQEASPFHVNPLREADFAAAKRTFKYLRIAYSSYNPYVKQDSPEVTALLAKAVAACRANGMHIQEAIPDIGQRELYRSYMEMNGVDTVGMIHAIEQNLGRSVSADDVEPLTWSIYQYGRLLPNYTLENSIALWDQAAWSMAQFFEDYDLYFQPTTSMSAPIRSDIHESEDLKERMRHYETLDADEQARTINEAYSTSQRLTSYSWIYNVTGHPSISIPIGQNSEGLPIGLQVTAPKGHEDWLLACAAFFEARGDFYQPSL